MTVEIAVQDVEGARIAHEEGADRVELCAALMGTGGLTPSFGMIQACSHVGVPQGVQVLIRPRGRSRSPMKRNTCRSPTSVRPSSPGRPASSSEA